MNIWMNNIQNAVGSVVNEFARAADDVVEGLRHPPQQNGRAAEHQQRPGFPFGIGSHTAPTQQQGQPNHTQEQRAPPASAQAIRKLPEILVKPEDLVDENNRECCICLDANCLGEKVTRLPCAHIFHTDCIVDWLRNHACTCPICRYELPTDNPMYEAGRAERMKWRKPRYARYELDRMSTKELVALNRGKNMAGIGEKRDLVDYLIKEGVIDLIPACEPVEYKMAELKAMKISVLKRAMEDAGVFFHTKDVVEKSDLISLFVNSGRLNVISACEDPEDVEGLHRKPAAKRKARLPNKRPLVETVNNGSDDDFDDMLAGAFESRQRSPVVMFPQARGDPDEETIPMVAECSRAESNLNQDTAINHTVQPAAKDAADAATSLNLCSSATIQYAPVDPSETTRPAPVDGTCDQSEAPSRKVPQDHNDLYGLTSDATDTNDSMNVEDMREPISQSIPSSNATLESQFLEPLETRMEELSCGTASQASGGNATPTSQAAPCPLEEYTICQLLSLGRASKVDLSSCLERREMVDILVAAGVKGRAPVDLQPSDFAGWSISQLRVLASEVKVDCSMCRDQNEMILRIIQEANVERPHLRNYLRALSPLVTSTCSQLRATARSWEMDISDCLEKEEIIQRLISRANQFGIC